MPRKATARTDQPPIEAELYVQDARMVIEGEDIARILLEWGAPPMTAGGAANDIIAYLADKVRGAQRLQ